MSWSSWHTFFVSSFFSSNFTDESEGILAYRITHGISRIFGRWPMARALYMLLLFLSRRFRRWRRFFFVGIILSHRFHRYTQIFLCGTYSNSRGYLHRPDRSPLRKSVSNCLRRKSPNKFRVIRWIKNLRHLRNLRDKKNVPRKNLCISVKSVGLFPTSVGICTDRIGRLCENPWVIVSSGIPPNKLRIIRWIKNLRD